MTMMLDLLKWPGDRVGSFSSDSGSMMTPHCSNYSAKVKILMSVVERFSQMVWGMKSELVVFQSMA